MQNKKPADRRQRRGTRDLKVVPVEIEPAPPFPSALVDSGGDLEVRWKRLWESELGQQWDRVTDMAGVERLFSLYGLRAVAQEAVDEEGPVVAGSQGQPVSHPMLQRMKDFDGEIRQLEDRLGLSPKARTNLGLKSTSSWRKPVARRNATLQPDLANDPRRRAAR